MVSGLQGRTYEAKLVDLGMVSLEERRHQTDMVQVYKILTGKDNVRADQWFEKPESNGVLTRRAADPLSLKVQRSRLDIRCKFFSQRVVEIWNQIPLNIRQSRSTASFKFCYKKHRQDLLQQA